MDVLSDVLESVRLRETVFRSAEARAGEALRIAAQPRGPALVAVTEGSARVEVADADAPIVLETGDIVLLPQGPAHVVHAGDAGVRVIIAAFTLEDRATHPLLSVLPPALRLRAEGGASSPDVAALLHLLARESAEAHPGGEAVVRRASDLLFMQVVRVWLAGLAEDGGGWLRALVDPVLGRALARIHEAPELDWTVASLAKLANLSRSAFAARFTHLVGESPLHYVTRWRMQKAAGLLRTGQRTLADIADLVGYESEAAFSKAYKRWVGVSPGAYRRAAQASLRTRRPRVPQRLGQAVTAGLALD